MKKGLEESGPKKIFASEKLVLSNDQIYGAAETRSAVSSVSIDLIFREDEHFSLCHRLWT